MDEDQANDIIAKLDYLSENTMTREQANEILEKLKQIAEELAEFHVEVLKQ